MSDTVVTLVEAMEDIKQKGLDIHDQLIKKNKKNFASLASEVKNVVQQLETLANQSVNEEVVRKGLEKVKEITEELESILHNRWYKRLFSQDTQKGSEGVKQQLLKVSHYLTASLRAEQTRQRRKSVARSAKGKHWDREKKLCDRKSLVNLF